MKDLFADRMAEAHELYEIARGGPHEEICWGYLEAVARLAKLATGAVNALADKAGANIQAV